MTPRTATTGVGWIATSAVWLYSETLPPVTGIPRVWQPCEIPRAASANCHMTPGSSGEPKFRQSEIANGRAPAVRNRSLQGMQVCRSLPVWIRPPKQGVEFYSGLSRAKLYELGGKGQIETRSLRDPGAIKGTRLFLLKSVLDFIA